MKLLEEKIRKEGHYKEGDILKVDSFLNHQMDIQFISEIGKEFYERFKDANPDKILTVEASGIGIAAITSTYFHNIPVVFAKKKRSGNLSDDVYQAKSFSFTKKVETTVMVDRNYINPGEKILIIDDFLAMGNACIALMDIVKQANAEVVGVGIVIEKSFQDGRERVLSRGVHLESLARIKSIGDGKIEFMD